MMKKQKLEKLIEKTQFLFGNNTTYELYHTESNDWNLLVWDDTSDDEQLDCNGNPQHYIDEYLNTVEDCYHIYVGRLCRQLGISQALLHKIAKKPELALLLNGENNE